MSDANRYYERQIILKEVGTKGQDKLHDTSIVVIGAGGLGSPLLSYLTAAGIGSITIFDHDIIDQTNLHRQTLFDLSDIGSNKAVTAAKKLSLKNPHIKIRGIPSRFQEDVDIVHFDIIIDCSDNFTTKFLAHDLAYKYKKLFCVASIHKFEGQLQVFNFRGMKNDQPCMRCLWGQRPSETCVQTCQEAGVIGAVPGILGSMQALEVIKVALNLEHLKNNENLLVNLLNFHSFKIKIAKNTDCALCGQVNKKIIDPDLEMQISYEKMLNSQSLILNLTNNPIEKKNDLKVSLDNIIEKVSKTSLDFTIVVICHKGITSLKAVKALRQRGYMNSFSVIGGFNHSRT